LADRKLRAQLGFDQPGERQVQVVASEQQVVSYRSAGEVDQVAVTSDANQAEVAGAAADIAH
jgi:hypothetical protein